MQINFAKYHVAKKKSMSKCPEHQMNFILHKFSRLFKYNYFLGEQTIERTLYSCHILYMNDINPCLWVFKGHPLE